MEETGPGSLKLVSAWSPERSLRNAIDEALRVHVAPRNVHALHGDTLLVFTDEGTSAVREWLAPLLRDGETLLVVEFEVWSSYGEGVDRRWLLRRGH